QRSGAGLPQAVRFAPALEPNRDPVPVVGGELAPHQIVRPEKTIDARLVDRLASRRIRARPIQQELACSLEKLPCLSQAVRDRHQRGPVGVLEGAPRCSKFRIVSIAHAGAVQSLYRSWAQLNGMAGGLQYLSSNRLEILAGDILALDDRGGARPEDSGLCMTRGHLGGSDPDGAPSNRFITLGSRSQRERRLAQRTPEELVLLRKIEIDGQAGSQFRALFRLEADEGELGISRRVFYASPAVLWLHHLRHFHLLDEAGGAIDERDLDLVILVARGNVGGTAGAGFEISDLILRQIGVDVRLGIDPAEDEDALTAIDGHAGGLELTVHHGWIGCAIGQFV